MPLNYTAYERQPGQHRVGHLSFLIDGLESEWTIDPTQYMSLAMVKALDSGAKPGEEAALKAKDICLEMAMRVVHRKIAKLQQGGVPGGLALGATTLLSGTGIQGYTAKDLSALTSKGEGNAVETYLNRGRLRGLTKSEREERQARRAKHRSEFDNEKDWQARRANLISIAKSRLSSVESALSAITRLKGEDVSEFEGRKEKLNRQARALRSEIKGYEGPFMASHGFQYAYTQYWLAAINLSTDDIRIWPLMTNTTLDTVRDAVDQFSDVTADEFDGSGYSSGGLALDSQAVAVDDANDRAEFDSADEVVTGLGAGTRSIQGVAVGKFNTNTAASLPLHWNEFASNKTPDGSDFTFVFNAEGILQAADG